MPELIEIKSKVDPRGALYILDESLPFLVRRVFFIRDVPKNQERGFHRHKQTRQILFCNSGSCIVEINDNIKKNSFILDSPSKALLVEPEDWHYMHTFSNDCVLMVLASHKYDEDDYITTAY